MDQPSSSQQRPSFRRIHEFFSVPLANQSRRVASPRLASPASSPALRREWPQPRITSQFPEIAQSVRANGRRAATAAGSGERPGAGGGGRGGQPTRRPLIKQNHKLGSTERVCALVSAVALKNVNAWPVTFTNGVSYGARDGGGGGVTLSPLPLPLPPPPPPPPLFTNRPDSPLRFTSPREDRLARYCRPRHAPRGNWGLNHSAKSPSVPLVLTSPRPRLLWNCACVKSGERPQSGKIARYACRA
jgi:hypothetical protein